MGKVILGPAPALILLYCIVALAGLRSRPLETVRIGVMGSLTGPGAGYGISQRKGVQLAAEEMNAGRLIPGVRIELIVVDDKSRQDLVGELAVRLIERDRVSAIIGCIDSACTHVLQMVTVKLHVPMITTTSTDPSITKAGSYWTFRCLASDERQAASLARYVFRDRGLGRVALALQNNRYGKMGAREFGRRAREAGRPVVAVIPFERDQRDFSPLVKRLRVARPDGLVIWGLYQKSAELVKEVRAAFPDLPLFGSDGLAHPSFLALAGEAAEGLVITWPFDSERDDPRTRDFIRRFERRFGHRPDSFCAHSYDALGLIAAAILRAGSTRPESVKDALLLTRDFPGVTGAITLDEQGDDAREVILAVVRDGMCRPLR